MTASIEIVPELPPAPYVLADSAFLSTLTECESRIAALKVADSSAAQVAADLQVRLTKAGTQLEKTRNELLRPALDWQTLINSTAKPVALRITEAKRKISDALTNYRIEQDRIAAQKEKDRLAEIRRLEDIARAEAAEAKRKADEIAAETARKEKERLAALSEQQRKEAAEVEFIEEPPEPEPVEKTETEQELENLKHAPAVVTQQPSGVRFTETLRPEVVDIRAVPEVFIVRTVDMVVLRRTFCVGWKTGAPIPEVPGVAFKVDRTATSTGRGAF